MTMERMTGKPTQHDLKLIEEAEMLSCYDWDQVNEDAAETQQGYERLRDIRIRLYHREEYKANLL